MLDDPMLRKIAALQPGFIFDSVELNISIVDARKMLVHYKIGNSLRNKTTLPIRKTPHYAMTDIPKSISELGLRAVDEYGRNLKVEGFAVSIVESEDGSILCDCEKNEDSPTCLKYLQIVLAEPLCDDESVKYAIEYETEEPERFFVCSYSCDRLVVSFDYPRHARKIVPFVFDGDAYQGRGRRISRKQFTLEKGRHRNVARCVLKDVKQEQSFTFRW
jgi:hypothetical protein